MSNRWFARGASGRKRLSLFLFLLPCLLSCYGTFYLKGFQSSRVIENVPFFPQEALQCGPAAMASVLNYWGVEVSPEEIATEIYSPSAGGTLNLDMILYAKKRGMDALHYQGSMEDLKKRIDSGHPLIVLVDLGFLVYQQNHFMVVVGYDEQGIIAHSEKTRLKSIDLESFVRTWRKANFWTLLMTPAS